MNKIAILSDVNGNLEALLAVLDDIDRTEGVDLPIVFLGDGAGYGADPLSCITLLRERCCVYLRGYTENHILEGRECEFTSQFLVETLAHAKSELASVDELWAWLIARPSIYSNDGVVATHADPRGANFKGLFFETIRYSERLRTAIFPMFSRLLFVGCNFDMWVAPEEGDACHAVDFGMKFIYQNMKYIVSVGSVGQSRDGDPRATYAVSTDHEVEWRRVDYDVNRAASKIRHTYQHGSDFADSLVTGNCS